MASEQQNHADPIPPEITGIIQFLYGRSLDLPRGRIAIRADHGKESHQNDMQKGKTFI
jgi:hypothetical protein